MSSNELQLYSKTQTRREKTTSKDDHIPDKEDVFCPKVLLGNWNEKLYLEQVN